MNQDASLSFKSLSLPVFPVDRPSNVQYCEAHLHEYSFEDVSERGCGPIRSTGAGPEKAN